MTNKVTLRDLMEMSEKIDKKLDKMGKRVTTLEIWKANLMGKITIIVGCVSLIFTMVWEYAKSKFKQ